MRPCPPFGGLSCESSVPPPLSLPTGGSSVLSSRRRRTVNPDQLTAPLSFDAMGRGRPFALNSPEKRGRTAARIGPPPGRVGVTGRRKAAPGMRAGAYAAPHPRPPELLYWIRLVACS